MDADLSESRMAHDMRQQTISMICCTKKWGIHLAPVIFGILDGYMGYPLSSLGDKMSQ